MQQSTQTLVTGSSANCYSNLQRASAVYSSTYQDDELFMLIELAML